MKANQHSSLHTPAGGGRAADCVRLLADPRTHRAHRKTLPDPGCERNSACSQRRSAACRAQWLCTRLWNPAGPPEIAAFLPRAPPNAATAACPAKRCVTCLINGEAIEQTGAACAHQILLAAASRRVR